MTNTGDFRYRSYGYETEYAIDYFNAKRSSTAPKVNERPERKNLRVKKNKVALKPAKVLEQEQSLAFWKAFRIVVCLALASSMVFGVLFTYAKKNELNHQINNLQTELSVSQSENTRLTSELDSMVSMSMIDQYAVEKLGMVKMKSNQISYIDASQYKENRLLANQKAAQKQQQTSKTIKK